MSGSPAPPGEKWRCLRTGCGAGLTTLRAEKEDDPFLRIQLMRDLMLRHLFERIGPSLKLPGPLLGTLRFRCGVGALPLRLQCSRPVNEESQEFEGECRGCMFPYASGTDVWQIVFGPTPLRQNFARWSHVSFSKRLIGLD